MHVFFDEVFYRRLELLVLRLRRHDGRSVAKHSTGPTEVGQSALRVDPEAQRVSSRVGFINLTLSLTQYIRI